MSPTRTRILCIGRPRDGDHGIGHSIFQALQRQSLPPAVGLCYVGLPALETLGCFEDAEHLVLVTSLAPRQQPGRVWVQDNALGLSLAALQPLGVSAALTRLLAVVRSVVQPQPRITLVGVEASAVSWQQGALSVPLQQAVAPAMARVLAAVDPAATARPAAVVA